MKKNIGLLLAAAAAYGAYKYSKMSAEEKNAIRARGKDFLDKNLTGLTDFMGKKKAQSTTVPNGSGF